MTHPGPQADEPTQELPPAPQPSATPDAPPQGYAVPGHPQGGQPQDGEPYPAPPPPHPTPAQHPQHPHPQQPYQQQPHPHELHPQSPAFWTGHPAYAPAPAPGPMRTPQHTGSSPAGPVRTRMPGWVWPVLALTALVTGLLGGLLGGALVMATRPGDGFDVLPGSSEAAAPLDAENGSIAAVAAKVLPSTVQVKVRGGDGEGAEGATGSGFVLDGRGHLITNNHVVEVALGEGTSTDLDDGGQIAVVDTNGRSHRATVVGRSPVYDLAVLKVRPMKTLRPAAMGSSSQLRVGQTVVAIGSPLGLSSTVTSGIVSALKRPVTTGSGDVSSYIDAVQTDAAINPGNSGGPLVNLRGQVVGVNSAIATTGGAFGGESGNIGVGFAIPMEQVQITARQILATGKAEYPIIGATVKSTEGDNGAVIGSVEDGTPAAEAGLREDDRVVSVDGEPVLGGIALIVAIRTHRPGETIALTVVRDGERRSVRVTLDAKVG